MSRFSRAAVGILIGLALALALALESGAAAVIAPDVLVQSISQEVVAAIKHDHDLNAGNKKGVSDLVEAKILPHFNFVRMTQTAMAAYWRRASPEQQIQLTAEFRALLVHTYAGALMNYRGQPIQVKPLRAQAGDTEVTVRTEIRQSGSAPIQIDYLMERTAPGWKVYDVKISGISLTSTYRDTFADEIRNRGIDGLIHLLSGKNRQNDALQTSKDGENAKISESRTSVASAFR